jgi:hypothetical protein
MDKTLILFALLLQTMQIAVVGAKPPAAVPPGSLFVQGKICPFNFPGTPDTACAYNSNVTANHTLVLIARWDGATARTISAIVNTAGGNCVASGTTAWTQITTQVASSANEQAMQSWYCEPASTGALTVSITSSVNQAFLEMNVSEFNYNPSGIDTSSRAATLTSTSTPCASGAGSTLTATGDLVVGWCGMWDNTQTWANTGSYIYDSAGSSTTQGLFDYTSAGTTAPSFSFAITADRWISMTVAFKP